MLFRAAVIVAVIIFIAWLVGGLIRDRTQRGRRRSGRRR